MKHTLSTIGALFAALAAIACDDSVSPRATAHVSVQDECDPASFNSALGAGTCSRQGSVTFAEFNAELNATQEVAAWRFVPSDLTINVGQSIAAKNDGGEVHTFTEVEQFGGGIIPALNDASGNTVEAPECAALTAADMIVPGGTFTTDAEVSAGTELYQCCIHPWMRAVVVAQ